jgi:hypothetical protein
VTWFAGICGTRSGPKSSACVTAAGARPRLVDNSKKRSALYPRQDNSKKRCAACSGGLKRNRPGEVTPSLRITKLLTYD